MKPHNNAHPAYVDKSGAVWLDVPTFAALVGLQERGARKALALCHEGGTWRGCKLEVRVAPSGGGPRGLKYQVRADSLPNGDVEAVADLAPSREADARVTSSLVPNTAPRSPAKGNQDEADWHLSVVQQIRRNSDAGTSERATLIREAAETLRYPYGKRRGKLVGARTIRNWITAYEAKGIGGLRRKSRSDARKRRVVISRQWDALVEASGVSENDREAIAAELRRRIASLWRSGAPSWPTVQLNALPFLMDLTCLATGAEPDESIRKACMAPRSLIEASNHFQAVAIRRKDAGLSAAIQTPRIRRDRSHLQPMEWVAGDVHHIDIAFRRDDGTLCTVKAVAWLDLATNRTFISPYLMPKGQMIRREHVIESFVAMCSDPSWGVPTCLYVDNGGEYNWGEVVADLCKIKGLTIRSNEDLSIGTEATHRHTGMRKSQPYNPQSKVIETLFATLEKVAFSQIPGHIGGDRMKKKTENQGKDPLAYSGTFDDFANSLNTAVNYYHTKTQQGHLNGQSPFDRFRGFVAGGWASTVLNTDELAIVFSREEPRQVRAGGTFSWGGQIYRHDALLGLAGVGSVLVRQPIFGDQTQLYVFDENEMPLCVAEPQAVYGFDDIRGSGEQQRQSAEFNRQIRALEAQTDPIDLQASMADAAKAYGPGPRAPIGGAVSVNSGFREMARMAREVPTKTAEARDDRDRRRKSEILARLAVDRGAA
jgi:hypothetical protein